MKRCIEEKQVKEGKSTISGQFPRLVPYQTGVVPVPPIQKPNGTDTNQSDIGTTHHNHFGIGTDSSGTGTTTSCNPKILVCLHY